MYHVDAEQLTDIAQRYGLDMVVIFGSQVSGQIWAGADIDVAVRMQRRAWGDWECELELIGELTEAITGDGDLDVAFLNGASPLLLFEVASSGVVLYQAQPTTFAQFQSYAARRYDDSHKFFKLRRKHLEEKYASG